MNLNYEIMRNKLRVPFETNHRVITDNRQLIVTISSKNLVGIGTGLLSYSEDEFHQQITGFKKRLPIYQDILRVCDWNHLEQTILCIKNIEPMAIFEHEAIDLALYDLLSKSAQKPLYKFFGYASQELQPSGFSISAPSTCDSFLKQLQEVDLRLPILKLKMKTETDYRVVEILRDKYQGRIWVDANCAWDIADLPNMLKYFDDLHVEIVEQPLVRGNFESLGSLKDKINCLILADEDCTNAESLTRLHPYYDAISIKLHKSGGILEALKMVKVAKQLNLKIMLGCRTECGIGITAISHLASSADFLDLDGAVDVLDDPYQGLIFNRGKLIRPEGFGIGVL